MTIDHVVRLSDGELTTAVGRLATGEREATVALIVHLGEFEARRLHERAGFSSTFKYCRAILHMSEDAIYNRIEAARAVRRHPALLDMLLAGSLSLTTVRLVARQLTAANEVELLAAVAWRGKEEVETLLADRCPKPDVVSSIRQCPRATVVTAAVSALGRSDEQTLPLPASAASSTTVSPESAPLARSSVRPLGAERYEVRFMASGELREKLRRARDLLGHAIPNGDLAQVIDRAVTLLVSDLERRKFGATERPRPSRGPKQGSRAVPAAVRRAVAARDDGRCAFVSKDGRRCDARRLLEFHHVVPYAVGGPATVGNIRLRCRAHNGHEVDRFFGPGVRGTRAATTRSGTTPIRGVEGPTAGT